VSHDPELVRTPLDKTKRIPKESLRRSNNAPPRQPALWAFSEVVQDPEPCYGRYPRGFLDRVLDSLGVAGSEVLHVCTGGMSRHDARGGLRVDLRMAARPDVVADGRRLPFLSESFAAVLLDPPYSVEYAETLYGVEYPRPSHLLAEAARVVRHGGAIGMLHYLIPVPPAGCEIESVLGVTQGLGYRIRAWTVYRKAQRGLPFAEENPAPAGRERAR
jgi:hypothetical protein